MSRPSWNDYFLELKDVIGKRATCDRGKSGCVIVDESHHIVSTGYVGAPEGLPHCDDVGHLIEQTQHVGETVFKDHCVRTLHAEQNAIAYAARKGVSLKGCTLYCTMTPCPTCAMLIIASGIVEVICDKVYQNSSRSIEMFNQSNITITHMSNEIQSYNKDNEIVIPFEYDYVGSFSEGLCRVQKDNKWGAINKSNEIVIPFEYDYVGSFSEGLCGVMKGDKYGSINKDNEVIIPFEYGYVGSFNDGFCRVQKDGEWGAIDRSNEIVVPFEYDNIGSFSEGICPVKKNDKWGAINRNNKIIIPIEYAYVGQFNDGLYIVKKNDKWEFINKDNEIVSFE